MIPPQQPKPTTRNSLELYKSHVAALYELWQSGRIDDETFKRARLKLAIDFDDPEFRRP